jgi:hypothetical protein
VHPLSKSWDEVEMRFRAFSQFHSLSVMVARMLHLVGVLREDPRLEPFGRSVSHASLVFSHAERCVAVAWSEPGGIAWAGEQGFHVCLVDFREMESWRHAFVEEIGVVAAVLERLGE